MLIHPLKWVSELAFEVDIMESLMLLIVVFGIFRILYRVLIVMARILAAKQKTGCKPV